MENDNLIKIFSTSKEADANRASEYLEDCNITCTVKKEADNEYTIWVAEKEEDKATSLLKDILPDYFADADDDTEGEDEQDEEGDEECDEEETGAANSNTAIVGIIGKVLLALSIVGGALSFLFPIPYIKIITCALAGAGIILNGYEGFKTQKTLPILLCLASIVVLITALFIVDVKKSTQNIVLSQVMSKAGNYLTVKDYANAVPLYEEAIKIAIAEKNTPGEILSLAFLGTIYDQQSQFEKSLEYYNRALKRCDETGNTSLAEIIRPEFERISKLVDKSPKLDTGTEGTK